MTVMIKVTGLCLNNLDPTYMYVHQNSLLLQSYSKPKTNHVQLLPKIGHQHWSAGSVTLKTVHERKPLIVCSCPTVDVGCQAETGQESLQSQRRAGSLSSLRDVPVVSLVSETGQESLQSQRRARSLSSLRDGPGVSLVSPYRGFPADVQSARTPCCSVDSLELSDVLLLVILHSGWIYSHVYKKKYICT